MRPTLLVLPLLAFLLLQLHHHASTDCESATCGNLTLTYPFWLGSSNQTTSSSPCGHPAFEVWCLDPVKGVVASLRGSSLHILAIDYPNSSLVSSHDRVAAGDDGVCRTDFNMSVSISLSPFTISRRNRALCFLYNCSSGMPPSGDEYVNATSSCRAPIYAYLGGAYDVEEPPAIETTDGCTYTYVPVLMVGRESEAMTAANYSRLLKAGFLLEWEKAGVGDCAACNATGGECRYNSSTAAFWCLCPGGRRAGSTCPGESLLPTGSHLPTSSKPCYVFVLMAPSFISPAMAVWSSLILILAAAAPASVQGEGDCSASNRCGNMTILEPFVIVPEDATEANCGEMRFLVNCQNNTPYLGYYHQSYESHAHPLQILHIFYDNSSLLVADTGKLGGLANLSHRDCQNYTFPSTNTSSKIALPFTISPVNKNLILYSCGEPPPASPEEGFVEERTCGNSTFVARVGGSYGDPDNSGRRYFLEGCDHLGGLANLSHRDCQNYTFPSTNTSSKIALPFTISPVNKNLILYSCAEPPPALPVEGLVEERTCGNSTFVARVGGSYGDPDNSGRSFLEGCDASILPILGESGEANASNYEELISNGFQLTWQQLPLPPSAAGASAASAAQPGSCWPKACGDLNITRPFWLEEPGWPPCGPPSFQLTCNSSGAFLSRSPQQAYRVVTIFAENQSLHVVDINLPLATGCPAPTFNVSTVPPPLIFSSANKDLLFLGKCTGPSPEVPAGFRSLSCDNTSFVRFGDGRNFTRDHIAGGIPVGCLFSVVPILGVGAMDGNGEDYLGSMRNGFLLEWADVPAGDCPGCIARGGECTYGDPGMVFVCKCSGSKCSDVKTHLTI
nr:unnamed protein product [Digitaria exilis]